MAKQQGEADSPHAWTRLFAALAIATVGGVGLWSGVVVLPTLQAEFGVARGDASLPYTLTLLGLCVGGLMMGRLADRFGVVVPVVIGAVALAVGYCAAAATANLWQFALVQGLVIGVFGA